MVTLQEESKYARSFIHTMYIGERKDTFCSRDMLRSITGALWKYKKVPTEPGSAPIHLYAIRNIFGMRFEKVTSQDSAVSHTT